MITAERKQQIFIGVGLFLSLSAIGFSVGDKRIHWFWEQTPFIAPLLMLLAFFAARLWFLLERERQKEEIEQTVKALQAKRDTSLMDMLSMRGREVVAMIVDGKTNKEIADKLCVELSTVKTHINNIYKILDVKNRREAIEKISRTSSRTEE